jgi:hypothetical protein
MINTSANTAITSESRKNDENPRAAAPPSSGIAQHRAHAPNNPRLASNPFFFIYFILPCEI